MCLSKDVGLPLVTEISVKGSLKFLCSQLRACSYHLELVKSIQKHLQLSSFPSQFHWFSAVSSVWTPYHK